ncbi:ACT domain-containing protein [Amycolatopsis sp. SID8362]|uniref:ACT domain-containing protein n=1 Tax=Amycolatopsis sp. SID8362 TaxID=2690346 RepID=UPI001369FAA2|nr:ACT domain-containing protein [Amycolatopsis sp. SID8362]NBH05040.1 ACT domain-containing protein [Amycolatopsis sp. SID8362]NED41740.1 ACT domain-containing protein [Amycolatopsis sp. SID8362]
MKRLAIDVQPGEYAVVRLPADAPVPAELLEPGEAFVSVTRTPGELSVICPAGREPGGSTAAEDGWRLLSVRGPLEFTLTGIIAALASELAAAGVALFSMSTFDTDHILVRAADLDHAVKALRESGHEVALT